MELSTATLTATTITLSSLVIPAAHANAATVTNPTAGTCRISFTQEELTALNDADNAAEKQIAENLVNLLKAEFPTAVGQLDDLVAKLATATNDDLFERQNATLIRELGATLANAGATKGYRGDELREDVIEDIIDGYIGDRVDLYDDDRFESDSLREIQRDLDAYNAANGMIVADVDREDSAAYQALQKKAVEGVKDGEAALLAQWWEQCLAAGNAQGQTPNQGQNQQRPNQGQNQGQQPQTPNQGQNQQPQRPIRDWDDDRDDRYDDDRYDDDRFDRPDRDLDDRIENVFENNPGAIAGLVAGILALLGILGGLGAFAAGLI